MKIFKFSGVFIFIFNVSRYKLERVIIGIYLYRVSQIDFDYYEYFPKNYKIFEIFNNFDKINWETIMDIITKNVKIYFLILEIVYYS